MHILICTKKNEKGKKVDLNNKDKPTVCTHFAPHSAMRHYFSMSGHGHPITNLIQTVICISIVFVGHNPF